MDLIARYQNSGFETVADGVIDFFDKRKDLQQKGISFGNHKTSFETESKISTDISLVAIDSSDPEAYALSQVILRGINAGLDHYLKERPLFKECCPENNLFVNPIFNLQIFLSCLIVL